MDWEDIRRKVDILAIPFFLILIFYLLRQKDTFMKYILLIFAISGFVIDVILTIKYFDHQIEN